MLVGLTSASLKGSLTAVASKSYAHRIIIAAALSDKPTVITGRLVGEDVEATLSCIKALGAEVERCGNRITVKPVVKPCNAILDCRESGSTLRFTVPVALALGVQTEVIGSTRLAERPLKELLGALKVNGANIEGERLPLTLNGGLRSGNYRLPSNVSSQYVTGLLMALPILDGDSRLELIGERVSASYVDITLDILARFGIVIEATECGYFIKGGQKYVSPAKIEVEGDWSNAAFFIVGGALCGDITIDGLDRSSKQGDKAIVDIMRQMGAEIECNGNRVQVKRSLLTNKDIDITDTPDIAPILAVAMACGKGKGRIIGVDRLRAKESDRLSAIIDTLSRAGAATEYADDALSISGTDKLRACTMLSYNDHRMAMSEAILAAQIDGECTIEGAEAIRKSYPQFYEDYKKLGGICYVIQP